MNTRKIREASDAFLEKYPGGFGHPELQAIVKKHQPAKITELARQAFAPENFSNPAGISESMVRIVSRASVVSVFEKPKFRDFVNSLAAPHRIRLCAGLEKFLHGDQQEGFEMMLSVLAAGKIAKWTLLTVLPFYFSPDREILVKPSTVKAVISEFELEGLVYKPSPSWNFYDAYRDAFNKMKKYADRSLSPDNGHFSGFLMMSLEGTT